MQANARMRSLLIRLNVLSAFGALALCVSAAHAGVFLGTASDRDGLALSNAVMSLKPIGRAAPATPAQEIAVSQENATF